MLKRMLLVSSATGCRSGPRLALLLCGLFALAPAHAAEDKTAPPAAATAGTAEKVCAAAPMIEKGCRDCGKQGRVAGVVEKVCVGCDTADVVGGSALEWDVVRVRLTTPAQLNGVRVAAKVLVEKAGAETAYAPCAQISFPANAAALEERKVMLKQGDIRPLR